MPSKSKAQHRWVASKAGRKVLGERVQKEWLAADRGRVKRLPERVRKHRCK